MGEMVDPFTLASPHVGGVTDIQQSENDPWDRNDAEQVKFAPRIEKDRGEHNSSNGTWSDIKTFNSSSTTFNCGLSGSYYVARGTYRVYAEFYAFNNTGVCVEIASGYSPVKDY